MKLKMMPIITNAAEALRQGSAESPSSTQFVFLVSQAEKRPSSAPVSSLNDHLVVTTEMIASVNAAASSRNAVAAKNLDFGFSSTISSISSATSCTASLTSSMLNAM